MSYWGIRWDSRAERSERASSRTERLTFGKPFEKWVQNDFQMEPKSNEKKVSKDEDIKSILKTPQKKKSGNTSSSIEQKILNKIRK